MTDKHTSPHKPGTLGQVSKRAVDLVLGATGLLVTSPLSLGIATAIRLTVGHPVLFRQTRPGLGGRPFTMVKFRTMREPHGEQVTTDESRITRFGALLRRTSLDELPELLNVLKGDMSLVGPRPLLDQYLDRYSSQQARRHEVKPGITGLAQVNGRNAISWEERLDLDVWYVDHQSLILDLRILARTVWQVIAARGINAPGHATMPEFKGSDSG